MKPAAYRPVMADVATVFHWSLAEMKMMPIDELLAFRKEAVKRARIN